MPWPTTYPFFHVDQPEQVDNAALLRRLQRPEGPVDVVLDTDTYNEIDDQYALAYLIKNDEKLKLKAIYAAPFCNNKAATPAIGMQKSYDEIKNILSLMGRADLLDCTYRGSESYLPDEKTLRCVHDPALLLFSDDAVRPCGRARQSERYKRRGFLLLQEYHQAACRGEKQLFYSAGQRYGWRVWVFPCPEQRKGRLHDSEG